VKLEDDKGDYKFDLIKKVMIKNSFEEPDISDARQSTRINFNGDKAALELEFAKNRRTMRDAAGMQNFGGGAGKHGGGMRGGNHSGGGDMSNRGMGGDSISASSSGTDNPAFNNEISQNPIELK
jgi:hypothetical protein